MRVACVSCYCDSANTRTVPTDLVFGPLVGKLDLGFLERVGMERSNTSYLARALDFLKGPALSWSHSAALLFVIGLVWHLE